MQFAVEVFQICGFGSAPKMPRLMFVDARSQGRGPTRQFDDRVLNRVHLLDFEAPEFLSAARIGTKAMQGPFPTEPSSADSHYCQELVLASALNYHHRARTENRDLICDVRPRP